MDFVPRGGTEAAVPADRDQDSHHGVTAETVLDELIRAGFERVEVEKRDTRGFLVVVRRPVS